MERLTAQDLSMLWPDDVGWPQDIGALVILEGRSLLGPDGRVRIDDVRHAIEARLHLIPRFRQRLYMPRLGLGWPLREATGEDPGDWGGSDRHRLRRTCPRPGMRCRCWRTAHAPRRSPETASPPATCSTDRRQRRRCGLLVTSPTRTT